MDGWPPEHIIQYYRPVTWADDGSWGYWTPIYMLNRIFWLQALMEIITNEMAKALNLLAEQQTKMHNPVYQNCPALDYFTDCRGGHLWKFNLSNCCLQIDDKGKVIEEITRKMTDKTHVPLQIWKGWNPGELFGKMFSYLGGSKTIIEIVLLLLGNCLFLPCLLPLLTRKIFSHCGEEGHHTPPSFERFEPPSQEDQDIDALWDLRAIKQGIEEKNWKRTPS